MKYFLTGATGFIGGRLAKRLLANGHTLLALVRTPAKAQALAASGVTLVQGDVTDKESMRAGMQGVDGVFHVAGWYKIGVNDPQAAEAVNIDGTRNLLELMQELGIAKGVYTSTLAVNSDTHGQLVNEEYDFGGQHLSLYDRTKAAAHDIAEQLIAAGLPLVIVMPGLVYGPEDTSSVGPLLRQYLQRKLPVIPQRTAYSWGHVDDIVEGHVLAMAKGVPGQTYIICGPSHTLVEALDLAQSLTGIPAPLHAPPALFKAAAAVMSVVEKLIPVPELYTAEGLRVIGGVTYLGDNSKARRELDYRPRSLRSGLAATLRYEIAGLGMTPPPALAE